MEDVLVFNKFFSDCRRVPQLRRYGPTNLYDGAEMAFFCVLYFQRAACMQYMSDLHSKFALRPHDVWKYFFNSNFSTMGMLHAFCRSATKFGSAMGVWPTET